MSVQSHRWLAVNEPPEAVLEEFANALNAPLASLQGSLETLNDDAFQDEQVRKDLQILSLQQVERIRAMLTVIEAYLEARNAARR